jgi:hypothetical protein
MTPDTSFTNFLLNTSMITHTTRTHMHMHIRTHARARARAHTHHQPLSLSRKFAKEIALLLFEIPNDRSNGAVIEPEQVSFPNRRPYRQSKRSGTVVNADVRVPRGGKVGPVAPHSLG